MDIFECDIDRKKLAATNKMWSQLKLNHSWVVGRTSTLIQQATFRTKEEWRLHYFETGEKRLKRINMLKKEDRLLLSSFDEKNHYGCKANKDNNLNIYNGRTQNELNQIGDILYGAMMSIGNPDKVTRRECRYIVNYRVVGETWNGHIREVNTIQTLSDVLGEQVVITKTDGKTDASYAVDAELRMEGRLICGIQIKPDSYRKNFGSNDKYKKINEEKNAKYLKDKGVSVIYIYSEYNGTILNKEEIKTIKKSINEETVAK